MLQTKTVSTELLGIIRNLMTQEKLSNYRLVGGTALALQFGHRKSVDIDLFGLDEVSVDEINELLSRYGKVMSLSKSKRINIFTLDGIKIDFVKYRYPWIDQSIEIEGIRFASLKDIGAMKINAITGRGSRKDFIDLYYLLKMFSIHDLLQFFENKYDDGSVFLAIKSLVYFNDADHQEMPYLFEKITWSEIKESILREYKKIL